MPYQGNLVAAMACPPANFVITPLALPESSSPQCWDVKEVPASSCPAPEDSCLVFKSARWFPYHWLQQSTRGMINWRKNELIKVAPFGARVVVVVVGWGGAKQEKTIPKQQLSRKPENHNFSFYVTSSSARKRPFLKEVILVLSSEQCSGGGGVNESLENWVILVNMEISVILGHEKTKIQNIIY